MGAVINKVLISIITGVIGVVSISSIVFIGIIGSIDFVIKCIISDIDALH